MEPWITDHLPRSPPRPFPPTAYHVICGFARILLGADQDTPRGLRTQGCKVHKHGIMQTWKKKAEGKHIQSKIMEILDNLLKTRLQKKLFTGHPVT